MNSVLTLLSVLLLFLTNTCSPSCARDTWVFDGQALIPIQLLRRGIKIISLNGDWKLCATKIRYCKPTHCRERFVTLCFESGESVTVAYHQIKPMSHII